MSNGFWSQRTSRGYVLSEVVSALQKACRRQQEDRATWWAAELERSGFGWLAWQRLETIVVEDIGVAWPEGTVTIWLLRRRYEEELPRGGKWHGQRIYLMLAAALCARAPKSRRIAHAVWANFATDEQVYPIPDEALDMHTARGRAMGRGVEHFEKEAAKLVGEIDDTPDPYIERYYALYDNEEEFRKQENRGRRPSGSGRLRVISGQTSLIDAGEDR